MKTTSKRGVKFIAKREGFPNGGRPYNDPVGHCTVGYGHLIHPGNCRSEDYAKWGSLSKKEARELLAKDLKGYEETVRDLVNVPMEQGHFDALVSFTFNLGAGNLRSSTLLKLLNEGHYGAAADEFKKWNKAGSPLRELPGLTARRKAEARRFRRATLLLRARRRG